MFIKHGDGKIINVVDEDSELEEKSFKKLKKLKNDFSEQLKQDDLKKDLKY